MAQLKVSDLSKEEQEKILRDAADVGLKGVFDNWGVEKLKKRIEAMKNIQNKDNSENTDKIPVENKEENVSENAGDDSEENKEENASENAGDDSEENKEENTSENAGDDSAENKEENTYEENLKPEKPEKAGICHICRSKVINGKCSGCGYQWRI
ncbi:TPA: hypothetical protein IAA87_05840 [Candidatus Avigastranaerophilus faecigallinarum]|nr:hypothetical protein [Candidatus Avigastranaerophilus faecigallinarum]